MSRLFLILGIFLIFETRDAWSIVTFGAASRKKAALLSAIQPLNLGVDTSGQARVLELVDDFLADAASVPKFPGGQKAVQGTWDVLWTTEKEVLFLVEKGLFGKKCTKVYQELDFDAGAVRNFVDFEDDAQLCFSAVAEPVMASSRVNFEINQGRIVYNGLQLPLPGVGKGWTDNVYVDSDIRIAKDVRGDTQIARRRR
mmetsp:Transcript_10752/g.40387  ORF Transcript_10752/g.40387 Transcript_10752/m.40387 type:complete len:199 (-) Transcript_10752:262-858(-)